MKRATRSLLGSSIILALAGGVGLYLWQAQQGVDPDEVGDKEDQPLVVVGKITRVEVEGRETYTLEERDDQWFVVEPFEMLGDAQPIAAIINGLKKGRSTRIFGDNMPTDGEMGIHQPLFNVRVVGEKGTALVRVGRISTFNRQLHLRIEDDRGTRTVLTDASLARALDRKPNTILNKRALAADVKAIERVEVTPRAGLVVGEIAAIPYTLKRTDVTIEIQGIQAERYFVVEQPDVDGPDIQTIQRIMSAFQGTVLRLAKDDEAARKKVGLDNPAWRVKYVLKQRKGLSEERELLISDPIKLGEDEVVYIARSDMPFLGELKRKMYDVLAATKEQLETKKLLLLDVTAVKAIEMELAGTPVRAERTPGGGGEPPGWALTKPEKTQASTNAVNKLVVAFSVLSAVDRAGESTPANLAKFGLAPGKRREVRFFTRGDLLLGEIWVGKQTGDFVYAMRKGAKYIARVEADRVAFVPKTVAELL